MPPNKNLFLSTGNTLVNRSAKFSDDFWKNTFMIPAAKASQHLWKAIDTCFFFNDTSGLTEDFTTEFLLQKIFVGASISTSIILNLYLRPIIISVPILSATYLEPNVDVSTVFCRFEYQVIGSMLHKIRTPVWDFRVT